MTKINKYLHIFCDGGVSGDMLLAAFIDLGLPSNFLIENWKKLPKLPEVKILTQTVSKAGISAKTIQFDFNHQTKIRTFSHIKEILRNSKLSDFVKENSLKCFQKIAAAEAKVHNKDIDSVHFHEIGSMDTILDITGFCLAYEYFEFDQIFCEPLVFGTGNIQTEHGNIPVPVPAVLEICNSLPFYRNYSVIGELVTPTGASLMASFAKFPPYPSFHSKKNTKLAYGAGTREMTIPNILRMIYFESDESEQNSFLNFSELNDLEYEKLVIIETDIDDQNPQIYEYLMQILFDNKLCLDTWITPIIMKKNRPANLLSILLEPKNLKETAILLLKETSSIGFRLHNCDRYAMPRRYSQIKVMGEQITIKESDLKSANISKFYPEYEDVKKAAKNLKIPFHTIYQMALTEYQKK